MERSTVYCQNSIKRWTEATAMDLAIRQLLAVFFAIQWSGANCQRLPGIDTCVNFKQSKKQFYVSKKMSFFGNSRRIAIWGKQTMVSHSEIRRDKGKVNVYYVLGGS